MKNNVATECSVQHARQILTEIIDTTINLCDRLTANSLPTVVYGMGNGADKVFDYLISKEIKVSGVFASDDFVRGQSFRGHTVTTLAQLEQKYGTMNIVVGFGSSRPELISRVRAICQHHKVFIPEFPVVGDGLFSKACAMEHLDSLAKAYSILADEKSQDVFKRLLAIKISANPELLWDMASPREEALNLLNLQPNEIFIDGGAYRGDSIDEFLEYTDGNFSNIVAFEPDRRTFKQLHKKYGNIDGITLENCALGSTHCTTVLLDNRGRGTRIAENSTKPTIQGQCMAIDELSITPTFIKLDIEGQELPALHGASKTIQIHHPKLHIALYHRATDFFELPLYVHSIHDGYKLYLRQHPHFPAWDLNLIAVV